MKLGNNVDLPGFTTVTRNVIMACYVAHLTAGHTILCKSIKSGTISKYLSAAAKIIQARSDDEPHDSHHGKAVASNNGSHPWVQVLGINA